MVEWLTRCPAKAVPFGRLSSNLSGVVVFFFAFSLSLMELYNSSYGLINFTSFLFNPEIKLCRYILYTLIDSATQLVRILAM